ncbi:chemotaxis protein CheD [Cytobacillus firmus]|uniref:Probable chemoreceptor glutamine deamidase CheD n=1 Tax=Cytobacillus firmus TaxID=1399 RepID=A0A380XN18_CYTFI|nr:chemotaxis protein CheD [Cytobacillus firmus]KAF0825831.1 Chemotaxis protein CheD [Cytobacillus firmus]MBG9542100.1 chemotaxis protein CheD [Cytobacillus firmus]MBG9548118.1 chemotaxis protein CheD [Cytobacillus firmus]MBG9551586.1 chemotaxis protein CheD [Cytobacillus firmus]MBG9556613.1 chemotaxis protein CheD [Cytobacillus firmus]
MNSLLEIVKVGIADMNIVKNPGLIRTSGLGSCVGVVLYDLSAEIAGLAHIMLPDSSLAKNTSFNSAKYADTAIRDLVSLLLKSGAKASRLNAKIAGGAQMFQYSSGSDLMRIGPRNVEAVKKELYSLKIAILGEDVGGHSGRTIEFNPESGELMVRTVNKGKVVL